MHNRPLINSIPPKPAVFRLLIIPIEIKHKRVPTIMKIIKKFPYVHLFYLLTSFIKVPPRTSRMTIIQKELILLQPNLQANIVSEAEKEHFFWSSNSLP
jgi:hypothetical protein